MHKLGLDFFLFTTKLYLNDTNANSVNLKSQSLRIDKKTTKTNKIQSRVSLRFEYLVAALYLNTLTVLIVPRFIRSDWNLQSEIYI